MRRWFKHFCSEEHAATAVEYAVMLALILAVVLGSIGAVGQQAAGMWSNSNANLNAQGFGS